MPKPKQTTTTSIAIGVVSFLFDKTEDFETSGAVDLSEDVATSGKYSQHFTEKLEFGQTLNLKLQDFMSHGVVRKVNVSAKFYGEKIPDGAKLVCSIIDSENKTVYWQGEPLIADSNTFSSNNWMDVNASFNLITDTLNPQDNFKIYIWNAGKADFYIDDLNYSFFGINPRNQNISEQQAGEQKLNWLIDLENGEGLENNQTISAEKARSGKQSVKMITGAEYGAGLKKQISNITYDTLKAVFFSAWICPTEAKHNLVLVCNVTDANGNSKLWLGKGTENQPLKINEWNLVNAEFKIAECNPQPGDYVVVYPWNKGGQLTFADDYTIVFNSSKHIGNEPAIDMREKSENNFPAENKPPFATIDLHELKVNGLEFNQPENANLNTNATLLAGNFTGGQLDEIAVINNNTCNIYGYCSAENKFRKIFEGSDACFSSDCKLLSVNSKNYTTQLLSIDKKGNVVLISFPSTGASACDKKTKAVQKSLTSEGFTFNPKQLFYSIQLVTGENFILMQDEANSNYCVLKIETDRLIKVTSVKAVQLAAGELLQVNKVELNGSPALISFSMLPEGLTAKALSFNGSEFKTVLNESVFKNLVEDGDVFYNTSFENGSNYLLKLNTGFKFDAKLIKTENGKVTVKYNVNFKSDFNPKYYEATKFVAGNFLKPGQRSCIVISCNCSDVDFAGINCKKFDMKNELPNAVQVYELKK